MMAQQMQFQQQMMEAQDMQQEQEQNTMQAQKGKGKGKPKKVLEIPASLVANPEKMKQLDAFMESYPSFEDRHKERLMASMATRIDTFDEDLETLYMAMGGARSPAGLLVGILKTMEDGEFKPRDAESRAQFRRAKELKAEAVEAQSALEGTGSIREKFMKQQKAHNKELEAKRRSPSPRQKRGRSDSRDRRRGRSRSRGGRGGNDRGGGGRDSGGYYKW